MAWISPQKVYERVREVLRRRPAEEVSGPPPEAPVAKGTLDPTLARQQATEKKVQRAVGIILHSLPLAMVIAGGLLSAFAELVGLWAMLGYLLVVAAPVVFWLERIELRLSELLTLMRNDE